MKILVFAGSARRESFNKRLIGIAAAELQQLGADVTEFDFGTHPMPLYDGDLEAQSGLPENAQRFKNALMAHDGFVIASPEYNSGYSPLLKNAIDWASRATQTDEAPLSAYRGKAAALLATSPGGLGGLRGLVPLRMLLSNIGVNVLPRQVAIPTAHEIFATAESFAASQYQQELTDLCADFAAFARRLVLPT